MIGNNMRLIILIILSVTISACSAKRVLVKDCKDAGPDLYNCESVKDL